jgi:UDP-N-acetylglucosamine acyltransferase
MSRTTASSETTSSGHVVVEDHAIISGFAAVHQFCRIGKHSIIGGLSKIVQDIPPFMIIDGNPATTRGLNLVGLQRRGFSEDDIKSLKAAYKKLFLKKDSNLAQSISSLKATHDGDNLQVAHLIRFIEESQRGITR